LIRARFCQRAGEPRDGSPSQLFTLGLFSVLDALTDTAMHVALRNLPITPDLRNALTDHTGAGRLLDCINAIENGDFDRADEILPSSPEHYLESVAWSTDAARQLIA
jgi:c-di-GMP phosphodiesterase